MIQALPQLRDTTDTTTFDRSFTALPNTISIGFCGINTCDVWPHLLPHVACSAGAACHSQAVDTKAVNVMHMSSVLQAMGVSTRYGFGTFRVSFGRYTTVDDARHVARHMVQSVLKAMELPSIIG